MEIIDFDKEFISETFIFVHPDAVLFCILKLFTFVTPHLHV